jgi:hypothetical protein
MRDSIPDAAALIRAGRAAFRPDAADRDRVLQSLKDRLGDAALLDGPGPGEVGHAAAAARVSLRVTKLWGGLAALAVGTGVIVGARLWTRDLPRTGAAPAVSSIREVEPEASATIASANEESPASEPPRLEHTSSALRGPPRTAPARTASLAEEVRLLSRAERQLSDGFGEEALTTLAEHEHRFPRGELAEERMAARVEALCSLARRTDARAELTRLARAYPKSAHLDSAQRFCGDGMGPPAKTN